MQWDDPTTQTALQVHLFLRERLVDLVSRRQILMARVRQRIDAGEGSAAEQGIDELKRLPSREQFAQRIANQQRRSVSGDLQVQAQIDSMFAETKKLLAQYLDPRPINDLQTDVDEMRRRASK